MSKHPTTEELVSYEGQYSEEKFWGKIKKAASRAGKELIRIALILYYELTDPKISLAQKGIIIGALGYFIMPMDFVPDWIPIAGFADDLAALKAAYDFIKNNITPEIEAKAEAKLQEWF